MGREQQGIFRMILVRLIRRKSESGRVCIASRSLFLTLAFILVYLPASATASSLPLVVPGDTLTGTIRGVLKHPILRRTPAAVYLELSDSLSGDTSTFKLPSKNPVMDQVNLTYTPHVLPVLVGSTIDFPNSDSTRHHVYTGRSSICEFELGIYDAGVVKHVTCDKIGVINLLCNVHAEMRGYIVVVPTPYFATTDKSGAFLIEGVPPGKYTITFEHERLESKSLEVSVSEGEETEVVFDHLKRKRH